MLRSVLSGGLVCAMLLLGCVSYQVSPPRSEDMPAVSAAPKQRVSVMRDVVYTPRAWPEALGADLFQPNGPGPFPAVVLIHGGGWSSRTRADMDEIGYSLAERGYVAMSVSHRFAPEWRFPAQLRDVQQAVLWLRANARKHRVDPARVASWGAHLAALLGVTGPGDELYAAGSRVQAVVAGGTPVDLRFYPGNGLTTGLMGVPYRRDGTEETRARPR